MSRLLIFRGTWIPGQGFVADTRPGRVVHGAGSGGSAEWGDITGLLIDQTDLQDALDDKEDAGTAASAVAAHAAAGDPHPAYLRTVEADALYDALGAATAAVATHTGLADPHTQYLTSTEGDAAYQAKDATLTALAGLNGTAGLVEQTGVDTFTKRAIGVAASTSILTRADGDTRYLGASAGSLTYVGSAAVAGSAATNLAISGLDLDTDEEYVIRVEILNAVAAAPNLSMFYNADTTTTNYDSQGTSFDGAATTSARANTAAIGGLSVSAPATIEIWIRRNLSGRVMAHAHTIRGTTTSMFAQDFNMQWRTASTNVTGITINSSSANALAIGSSIKVWKRKAV